MEHAASPYAEQLFPWRTAAVVAAGIAALELLVILVIGIVALAPSGSSARAAAKAATPTHQSHARARTPKAHAHRVLAPGATSVLVLNGNGIAGAAASEAARVRSAGYRVGGVGNADHLSGGPTVVMYRPRFDVEARRLARTLGIRVVAPLDGLNVSALHGAHVVVVLGG